MSNHMIIVSESVRFKLPLCTGGTGYLGSHVIHQLLKQDQYIIRATVRPGKVANILRMFPNAGSNLQVAEIASLTADHSEVLKDVYAVLHVASPTGLAGNISGKELFEVSIFFCDPVDIT